MWIREVLHVHADITRLEGYQLLVEYINGDDEDCAEQDNMAYNIERVHAQE